MKDLLLYSWKFEPSDKYYEDLNENAIIIFDTNCLVDIYRMSSNSADKYLEQLKYLRDKDRIWIPYQIGYEFIKNSQGYIEGSSEKFSRTTIDKKLNDIKFEEIKKIIAEENNLNNARYKADFKPDWHKYKEEYDKLYKGLMEIIEKIEKEYNQTFNDDDNKKFFDEILSLFESKTGEDFSKDELDKIYQQGEDRYKKKIPPGFEDEDKKDYRSKYGDYIIWEQLLKYAKEKSKPVIFVTQETKPDWWITVKNKRKPHPELRREFMNRVNQSFWMYDLSYFTKEIVKHLGVESSPEVAKEAENLQNRDQSRENTESLTSIGREYINFEDLNRIIENLPYARRMREIENMRRSIENPPQPAIIREMENMRRSLENPPQHPNSTVREMENMIRSLQNP